MIAKRFIFGASNMIEPSLKSGFIIDNRYKVIKLLGSGSYGRSYLVDDLKSEQKMVLKALRLHRRLTNSGRQAFEQEMQLLNKIDHPGFPKFFQAGSFRHIPFYTMEFIKGKNFEQLIFEEEKIFNEVETFVIASKLLSLIHYLHAKKIIHRDIRIPNVISDGFNIFLIDLGLAIKHVKSNDKKRDKTDPRREGNQQADFYALGHFILFLLYSNYSFTSGKSEKSWEEELCLSPIAKHTIERLLQIKTPYDSCTEIETDFQNIILNGERSNVTV